MWQGWPDDDVLVLQQDQGPPWYALMTDPYIVDCKHGLSATLIIHRTAFMAEMEPAPVDLSEWCAKLNEIKTSANLASDIVSRCKSISMIAL